MISSIGSMVKIFNKYSSIFSLGSTDFDKAKQKFKKISLKSFSLFIILKKLVILLFFFPNKLV